MTNKILPALEMLCLLIVAPGLLAYWGIQLEKGMPGWAQWLMNTSAGLSWMWICVHYIQLVELREKQAKLWEAFHTDAG